MGSSDNKCINILGIVLHVTSWVMAFVADVIVITKVDPNADSSTFTDKQFFDYQMASLVPFGLGFALVLLGILYHWVMVGVYKQPGFTKETLSKKDKLPKSVEAVLKGAVAVGILFAFVIIQFPQTGLQDQSGAVHAHVDDHLDRLEDHGEHVLERELRRETNGGCRRRLASVRRGSLVATRAAEKRARQCRLSKSKTHSKTASACWRPQYGPRRLRASKARAG